MWMQVAGAACNISTNTNKQPSHHQDEQQQVVNLEGGRRLRPLIPRPSSSSSSSHASNFGLYTAGSVEAAGFSYNKNKWKEESNSHARPSSLSSLSRWNPTAEQVGTLEELYSHGTRSPSTEEIQVITAQLRRYGNIEGKNVFYWFQNHKARERHKRRRHNLLLATKDGASTAHNYWKLGFDAQHSKEFGEMSMQLERDGRRGVSVSDIRSESTATTTTTRPNNPIIGSRAVACNATWRNLDPSSSSSSCAIFKTRRLVGTDGTCSIHREREREMEYEEQEQEQAPLLQLFPLTALVNAGQHHEETKTDDVRFFQFLPPKSIN